MMVSTHCPRCGSTKTDVPSDPSWGEIVTALENKLDISELPTAVPDSGMGRWTAEEAIRLAVPTPTLATALHARFASRDSGAAFRVLNAARAQVGGQRP